MCPACMAGAALVAGSVMSTGGIAALAVKMVGWKKSDSKNVTERRNEHGNIEYGNGDEQNRSGDGGGAAS
jgi:hypothetical protein